MTTRTAYGTQTTVQINPIWCSGCGIPYGLPEGFLDERKRDHKTWTCPNGCVRHYPGPKVTEEDRLRRQLEVAETRALGEAARRRLAERQRAAAKGQVTKLKNRVARGVCPCCNRTFENLARHMAGQHPDYADVPRE